MKIVAIDGGPRAGKDRAISALKEEFGSQVFILKESATAVMESGIDSPEGLSETELDAWLKLFQPIVFGHQTLQEWNAKRKAKREGAKIIIANRGVPSQAAYIPGGYEALERLTSMNKGRVLSLYDRALCMTSTAVFDPEGYERDQKSNNQTRYESVGRAQELDERIQAAWNEHPKLLRIDHTGGIDKVVRRVVEAVQEMLDEECEAKYLLTANPSIVLPAHANIRQGYLPIVVGEHRVRQADDQYFETYKMGSGAVRFQDERKISRKLFEQQLWPCTANRRLYKNRHIIPITLPEGDFFLELDNLYNKGRLYLECEFDDDIQRQQLGRAILPDWAQDAIDVTDDEAHKARNLADEN